MRQLVEDDRRKNSKAVIIASVQITVDSQRHAFH
jgi:hypothetical protein